MQMGDEVQRVPGQIADEVPAGSGDSGANSRQGSGGFRGRKLMRSRGFWCRWLMRFQQVPGQMAKILPRSSKLLGITHEFIFFPGQGSTLLSQREENGELVQVGVVSYTSAGRDHFTRVQLWLAISGNQSCSSMSVAHFV